MSSIRFLIICVTFCALFVPYLCLVSSWGEFCNFTAECDDHRLICTPDHENITRCTCDRFHEWQGHRNGCVQMYDAPTILNMTMTSIDNKGELEKNTVLVFTGQKIAGFFVMTVALLCPFAVIIHCFHMRRKDRALKREVKEIKERVDKKKRDSSTRRSQQAYVSLA
ncbi:uncharacterized protein [Atheta coriaria]|uniref:uncharacterized protein n=1 Tax=Dalotia coriaria TaxID=877792 RepID=UPI0031F34577